MNWEMIMYLVMFGIISFILMGYLFDFVTHMSCGYTNEAYADGYYRGLMEGANKTNVKCDCDYYNLTDYCKGIKDIRNLSFCYNFKDIYNISFENVGVND